MIILELIMNVRADHHQMTVSVEYRLKESAPVEIA